jgi:hypothetical protein
MSKAKQLFAEFATTVDLTAIPDYEINTGEIVVDIIESAPTLSELIPMTGVKPGTTQNMNIMSTDIVWQTGDCVTTPEGTVELKPRPATCVRVTDRMELCLDQFEAKLPMIMRAGQKNEDLPFAAQFIDFKKKLNTKELEKLAWAGNTAAGTGNLEVTNGYVKLALLEASDLGFNDAVGAFNVNTAVGIVQDLLDARTDAQREIENFTIYMSPANYSILANSLVAAFGANGTGYYTNLGNPNVDSKNQEFIFPGTDVRIKATFGLSKQYHGNKDYLFATGTSNLRYVTDLEADRENFELYFDKYHKALVSDLVFAIGFQYEFASQVMLLEVND